jgi:murein DD-endopeptidase
MNMRAVIAAIAAAALVGPSVRPVDAQIPPSIELRVPKPPTVAAGAAGAFLAYELHVTNLTANDVRLSRIDVLDGPTRPTSGVSAGTVLHTAGDSALRRDIHRPGALVPPADRPLVGGGMRAIVYLWFQIDPDAAPAALRHRITVQEQVGDSAVHVIESGSVPVYPSGPVLGAPLRGEWVAVNGPSNTSGHRRLVLALNGNVASGQRFGIDFVRFDGNGSTNTGDATRNDTHHAYGEDVLAVGAGVVVETKDGIPENVPGLQSRAIAIDLKTVSGNSVVIDLGSGRYAFYAHLIPGSLRVSLGDRVQRGQVIGLVGNSGNSTEPHLHFHIVDGVATGTSTLGAEGIPYALEHFELGGRCTLFGGGGCERTAPVTVRGRMPLQNQIVRFPD